MILGILFVIGTLYIKHNDIGTTEIIFGIACAGVGIISNPEIMTILETTVDIMREAALPIAIIETPIVMTEIITPDWLYFRNYNECYNTLLESGIITQEINQSLIDLSWKAVFKMQRTITTVTPYLIYIAENVGIEEASSILEELTTDPNFPEKAQKLFAELRDNT